jgi:hypothetical protein
MPTIRSAFSCSAPRRQRLHPTAAIVPVGIAHFFPEFIQC